MFSVLKNIKSIGEEKKMESSPLHTDELGQLAPMSDNQERNEQTA